MKVKYSKFEKVTGAFVLATLLGMVFMLASVAIQQGWLASKIHLRTEFESGDGIRPGTVVQMSGLRVGKVRDVSLNPNGTVSVQFEVFAKYQERIRGDSVAQMLRPFVIGEKVMELSMGTVEAPQIEDGGWVQPKETIDLLTLFGGRNLNESLVDMSGMLKSVKRLAEAFLNEDRAESMIAMFDRIDPLLKNLNKMSVEVSRLAMQGNRDDRFGQVLGELAITTKELNYLIPEIKEQSPNLARDLSALVTNMSEISGQFKMFVPAFAEVAPELPRASRRAIEALDEAVVLMKAMQKSFLVRSHVKDVRDEEAQREPAQKKNSKIQRNNEPQSGEESEP